MVYISRNPVRAFVSPRFPHCTQPDGICCRTPSQSLFHPEHLFDERVRPGTAKMGPQQQPPPPSPPLQASVCSSIDRPAQPPSHPTPSPNHPCSRRKKSWAPVYLHARLLDQMRRVTSRTRSGISLVASPSYSPKHINRSLFHCAFPSEAFPTAVRRS